MADVEVKCAECGHAQQLDRKLLGTSLKCPKCKETFVAETGDSYALAKNPRPKPAPRPATPPSSSSSSSTGRKAAPRPGPDPDAERRAAEQLEKWASDQDE